MIQSESLLLLGFAKRGTVDLIINCLRNVVDLLY